MNRRKLKKIYAKIAKEHGVSVEEVAREIEVALAFAKNSPDPNVQANWANVPCKGDTPRALDVITHLAKKAKENTST